MTATTLVFRAEFPTTEEDLLEFAVMNSYTEQVQQPVYATITETIDWVETTRQELRSYEMVDNTESVDEFICRIMKEHIAQKLIVVRQKRAQEILNEKQNLANQEYSETIWQSLEVVKSYLTIESLPNA